MTKENEMMDEKNTEEHRERHKKLHKALDELVADYIAHTEHMPSETRLIDFMRWAADQTIIPTIKP
jgi:hypothetical protein